MNFIGLEEMRKDFEFLQQNVVVTHYAVNNNEIKLIAEFKGIKKEYHPLDFLELKMMSNSFLAEKSKKIKDKASYYHNSWLYTTVLIQRLKDTINENKMKLLYDFTGIENQANAYKETAKFLLDSNKFDVEYSKLELESEKLRKELKWYKDPKFYLGVILTATTPELVKLILGFVKNIK